MIVLIWLFSRPFTAYKFQLKFRLKVLREQVNFANLNFKGFNLRIITWHWELVQRLHILFLMIFDSIYTFFWCTQSFPFYFAYLNPSIHLHSVSWLIQTFVLDVSLSCGPSYNMKGHVSYYIYSVLKRIMF